MSMEITGKIISLLPEVTGQGKNGLWRKQEFVLEVPGQYPKKVCMEIWGDKIDQYKLTPNETVTASIDLESREFNNKWYTNVRAWKVERSGAGNIEAGSPPPAEFHAPAEMMTGGADDLPF